MQALWLLTAPAYLTDFQLCCLFTCRMVKFSIQHGMSDASTLGFSGFGLILGSVFHRYREGYRFAKLACDLVEKHGFIANQPKLYHMVAVDRTQPIGTAIDLTWAAIRTAIEMGDLTFLLAMGCSNLSHTICCGTIRSTRCSASRMGARLSPGKPGFRRRRGHHPEPATLHRDHAGPDRDLPHFQRRAVRRGGIRGATAARSECHDDLLLLDPETEGAVPVERLRRRSRGGPTRRSRSFGPQPVRSSYSITSCTPR